ncbi:OPT family oligopeptide transporter [Sphingosinicella sp. BN140058]|uniref:OPT family oligopeptide transporter n=1 Tax=Sphingosinicella sp. BN140058 TaxID=1892855 RepID=UPI0010136227|nr:oligopeptide transporter, OPT family [Sphingosinicella sp. BN140058]QAY75802.1 oligopeptide transporter, OPT family [Sphingosinicella sp. BN140058]
MSDTREAAALPELTVRAVLLGGVITLLFTAANVYLGLRVGLTFATSIPAAVISMAVLRWFSSSNILENNIVQTVASAAGTLAAICFVLPGLVMIGWWQGFPYWTTALVTFLGGALGVLFSIPLRRALVTDSPLPFPEGVAAAEVLKVGEASRQGAEESSKGLMAIVAGSLVSSLFALLAAMRLTAADAAAFFRFGPAVTGFNPGFQFALLGAGHLVGLSVGLAMGLGLIIAWGVAVPLLSAMVPNAAALGAEELATDVWVHQVRFLGAGVIGVAAVWTLLSIIGPIVRGLAGAIAASRARRAGQGASLALSERDMPISALGLGTVFALLPIGWLLVAELGDAAGGRTAVVIALSLAFILVAGAFIAAVCGYMAGLIGASNSPVSGIGILAAIGSSLLLLFVVGAGQDAEASRPLVAYALIVTGIVFGITTISNDNLQDLKTGQLVGATPWRQQVALLFGVLFGAAIIPPVLSLLNAGYGFAGAPGAGPEALPAPQAALISAIAQGVLGGALDWRMIGYGVLLGVALIIVDAALGRAGKTRLPPLAIGIGIYLPMSTTLMVVVGAIAGWVYDRRAERARDPEAARRMGVLAATGLIVGESLFGVLLAGIVVGTGSATPLAIVGDGFRPVAVGGGALLFALLALWLYRRSARAAA